MNHTPEEQAWLEKVTPGSLLYNVHNPSWGSWLVIHAETSDPYGVWVMMSIILLGGPGHGVTLIKGDAGTLLSRWHVVVRA
jgi:hypothetical protein